ncbi:hypothetical protein AB0L06_05860 [Spirillospora sp. NPDC052269]
MVRALSKLSDRMIDRVLPSTKAKAEACWWSNGLYCCVYAGHTYCT